MRAAGRHTDAVAVLRRAIALQPTFGPSVERIERELADIGDLDGATDFRLSQLRTLGDRARAARLAEDIESLGPAEARRLDIRRDLDQLLVEAESGDPFFAHPAARSVGDRIALAYSDLGDWSDAVTWIERAYAHRPGRLRRLIMDMPFDRADLASDRRYVRLLRVAGLEDLISLTPGATSWGGLPTDFTGGRMSSHVSWMLGHLFERYVDSAATLTHIGTFGEKFAGRSPGDAICRRSYSDTDESVADYVPNTQPDFARASASQAMSRIDSSGTTTGRLVRLCVTGPGLLSCRRSSQTNKPQRV